MKTNFKKGRFYLIRGPNSFVSTSIWDRSPWWMLLRFDRVEIRYNLSETIRIRGGGLRNEFFHFTLLSGSDDPRVRNLVHGKDVVWSRKIFDRSFDVREVFVEDFPLYMGEIISSEFESILKGGINSCD